MLINLMIIFWGFGVTKGDYKTNRFVWKISVRWILNIWHRQFYLKLELVATYLYGTKTTEELYYYQYHIFSLNGRIFLPDIVLWLLIISSIISIITKIILTICCLIACKNFTYVNHHSNYISYVLFSFVDKKLKLGFDKMAEEWVEVRLTSSHHQSGITTMLWRNLPEQTTEK